MYKDKHHKSAKKQLKFNAFCVSEIITVLKELLAASFCVAAVKTIAGFHSHWRKLQNVMTVRKFCNSHLTCWKDAGRSIIHVVILPAAQRWRAQRRSGNQAAPGLWHRAVIGFLWKISLEGISLRTNARRSELAGDSRNASLTQLSTGLTFFSLLEWLVPLGSWGLKHKHKFTLAINPISVRSDFLLGLGGFKCPQVLKNFQTTFPG